MEQNKLESGKLGVISTMNNAVIQYLTAAAGSLLSGTLLASSLTIPNTFVSGTPALAEEINANFGAVKTAVNDNDTIIRQLITRLEALEAQRINNGLPVFLKADGQNVGVLVGKSTSYTAVTEQYDALSFKEYFFSVAAQSGALLGSHTIYYAGANCTGQAYIAVDQLRSSASPRGIYTKYQGEVFAAKFTNDTIPAYYVEANTDSVSVTPASAADFNTCSGSDFQHQFEQIDAYLALPNDPDKTGVQNAYATPIRAGF
jgi:hypothetical protein